jgi:hypothetical protein
MAICIIQGGPPVTSWFITPLSTDISHNINIHVHHIVTGFTNQLSYLGTTTAMIHYQMVNHNDHNLYVLGEIPIFSHWPYQEPKLEVPTIYKAYVSPM